MDKAANKWVPSAIQAELMLILIDPDEKRNLTRVLQDLGIPRTTYYGWMHDPNWQMFMSDQTMSMLRGGFARAGKTLMRQLEMGSAKHLEIYFTLLEKYVKRVEIITDNEKMSTMTNEQLIEIMEKGGIGDKKVQ